MLIVRLLPILVLLSALVGPARANDLCDLAQSVAEKGIKAFATDQTEGLKLLIKARELCPTAPRHAANLGMAYYRYGRIGDAAAALEEAVKGDGRNATWLNNLAQILLERQVDPSRALKLAKQADQLAPGTPGIPETLARARFAAGREVEALKGLAAVAAKAGDKRLADSYAGGEVPYMANKLKGTPQNPTISGGRDTVLAVLK